MLTAEDFKKANDPEFLKANPKIREELVASEREYPPIECVECFFFRWIFGEDKRISGGLCAAKPEITPDKFEYGKIAEGCPLI